MTEQGGEEKARAAAQKVKERLKRRKREAAFERAMSKNLKLETQLSSEALFSYRLSNSMASKAMELESKRTRQGYVV
jgi:hypothetical protein